MKKSVILLSFVLCCLITSLTFAAENIWQGINYSSTGSSVSNVDDSASWSLNRVPGVGNDDRAVFLFQSDKQGAVQKDLYIWSTNQFNPSSIYFDGNNGADNYTQDNDLYLEKSLTLTNFTIRTDTSSSGRQQNRIRLNNTGNGSTLTMAGDNAVFDISGAFWEALNLQGNVIFTATNIFFPESDKAGGSIIGADGINDTMVFTNSASTITLGARAGAAINLGAMKLFARSGQTWNCDTNAYISMLIDGTQNIIETTDGRLDTMGEVSFYINHTRYGSGSTLTMPGGTFGSLNAYGGGSRSFQITAGGDIDLMRTFKSNGYGLTLYSSSTSIPCRFYLDGYDLSVLGGIKLAAGANLYAYGSKVYVKGDIESLDGGSSNGIYGDGDTELWFTGSYSNNHKSIISSCLYQSTVNAVGNGTNQYFEVGDISNLVFAASGTMSIGTFNVGIDSTNATVTLVNNFLNNNPIVVTNEAIDKIGEKLVVSELNIASNSTLDLNGQPVSLGAVLNIEETGWLDLNTGIELYNGYVVSNFVSSGGNYNDWVLMKNRVIDSSQPDFSFRPKEIAGVSTPYGANSYLNFDGVNDGVNLSTGDGLTVGSRTPFTVELWMKGEAVADSWGYAIHRGDDENVGSSIYWIGVNGFSGNYGAAVSGNITAGVGDTDVAVEPNVWHHLALTYDGTNQSIYVDGVLERGPSNVGAIDNDWVGNKVGIGSTPNDYSKRPIKGIIAEVRIWDYTRSGTEIADNMNHQMTGSESGLVGYWPVDDGAGTVAKDLAGDNDGTLANGPLWSAPTLYWEVFGGPAEGTLLIIR